jgi:hypothetical protein
VVREVALATFGRPGAHLADLWAFYNGRYFAGRLRPLLVLRTRVFAYGHCIGLTRFRNGDGEPYRQILVKEFGLRVCPRQRAVLLHEMLHQFLFERGDVPRGHHQSQSWCDEVMRVSAMMGVKVWAGKYTVIREGGTTRRGNKPGGAPDARVMDQDEISRWPDSISLYPPDLEGTSYAQLEVTNEKQ